MGNDIGIDGLRDNSWIMTGALGLMELMAGPMMEVKSLQRVEETINARVLTHPDSKNTFYLWKLSL